MIILFGGPPLNFDPHAQDGEGERLIRVADSAAVQPVDTPIEEILDTVLEHVYVAFTVVDNNSEAMGGGAAESILMGHVPIIHCEIVFEVVCKRGTRGQECWCETHPGFSRTRLRLLNGRVVRWNDSHVEPSQSQYTYHSVSFAAYRLRARDLCGAFMGRMPVDSTSGAAMRLDGYLSNTIRNGMERHVLYKINPIPGNTHQTTLSITRGIFKWCLDQCVDNTNRSSYSSGGYAYSRAALSAIAARFVTPRTCLGHMLMTRSSERPDKRSKWFCSEFVAYAVMATGAFDDEPKGVMPKFFMTPFNLYLTMMMAGNKPGATHARIRSCAHIGLEAQYAHV